ncbi:NAD-dependent epimerase/dehydratase family protein [Caulobacter sp. BK020]|uniref:polysaccharide biosynthesis C-terminal domain-containing protein n=1 Tax=Caulobacter sp. BK020 TaxID=2512117 RepID=UPI00104FC497|nr:NAD-dependent epimerase/dehydratase family protein [Caulobacter sp. BK020]TCS14916.1 UDP-2-acetamido-2,6-beta-L-arabino-hexul-4-ose reductase [Caulobacter sp. BK020]
MIISERPTVAVTGASGFIGRNLIVGLRETGLVVWPLSRATPRDEATLRLAEADVVVHLAGAVRPQDPAEFDQTNAYAAWMAEVIEQGGRKPLIICASSVRADDDTPYGASKRAAEQRVLDLAQRDLARAAIYRLPNVFGKWARPNYNSCIATFCHNLARGLPIRIDDPSAPLSLVYVDDLVDQWRDQILEETPAEGFLEALHVRQTTVGDVAEIIGAFADGRSAGEIQAVGEGLARALYATFVSALPTEAFSYPLIAHTDPRGSFIEILKTPASGQVSYFTAHPGVTRGGHYHHSKVEKFLIVHGEALFRFRHILTGDVHEVRTSAETPVVVETIPGWAHDVTNVGRDMMVSLIWASEVFDRARPDTVAAAV